MTRFLTDEAKAALTLEIERRGLTAKDLSTLLHEQAQYTAAIEKQWSEQRQEDARRMGKRFAFRLLWVVVSAILTGLFVLFTTAH